MHCNGSARGSQSPEGLASLGGEEDQGAQEPLQRGWKGDGKSGPSTEQGPWGAMRTQPHVPATPR